jgi:hypothetical protein
MKKEIPTYVLWIIGISTVLILWLLAWYVLLFSPYKINWVKNGTFGDMFSAVSALFSGFAFVAVVITLYLQSKSISITKKELEEQKFENKFFQLLNVQNQILNGIEKFQKSDGENILLKGKHVFKLLYEGLISIYKSGHEKTESQNILELIKKSYKTFFESYQSDFGHYFRHLYHIVKFIDESKINDKQSYINLLRAQLSSPELLMLFYNCLSEYGYKRFKPLIETYALLENIPDKTIDKILNLDKKHKALYKPGAFQENINK